MNNKLEYVNFMNNKDILMIDLHNNYTVIAIKSWNQTEQKYTVVFYLKENTIDKWDLIDTDMTFEFNIDYKIINKAILKTVSNLLDDGFFAHYINRYEYETECFAIGNHIKEVGENNAD